MGGGAFRTARRPHLLPVAVDFVDGAGPTITLAPYLRDTCLTTVNLTIDAASAAR
jgi:hypothetical protein